MANSTSIIRVSIIGDASGLTTALAQGEGKLVGFGKKVVAGLAFLKITGEVNDFIQTSLGEYQRLADATDRLTAQLGGPLADELVATAGHFSDIGLSKQDVLELEAHFADMATTLKITDPLIATMADNVAATAGAIALLRDLEPDKVVDLIGKAAGGSAKAAATLGVTIEKGLTPAEQLNSILTQLHPALVTATDSTVTLTEKQAALQAKFETLTGKIGEALQGPLLGLLNFLDDEINAIPHAIEGFEKLGAAVEDFGRVALTPLARIQDVLTNIANAIQTAQGNISSFLGSEAEYVTAQQWWERRNQGKP